MDELPFGYTHRQKRSRTHMEASDRSVSPAWTYTRFSHPRESPAFNPNLSFYHYDNRRTPSFDPTPQPYSVYDPVIPAAEALAQRSTSASALPHPHRSGLHLPQAEIMPASVPRRFAGDGFDYRRPAGSAAAREQDSTSVDLTAEEEEDAAIDLSGEDEIIDLTADDSGYGASQHDRHAEQWRHPPPRRLPRGMDIIIDLDDGQEEWRMDTPMPEPGSPEIEFISSRPIDQPRQAPSHDEDDVEFVREQPLPDDEVQRRRQQDIDNMVDLLGTMNGQFNHLQAHVARFTANMNRTAANITRVGGARARRGGPIAPPRGPPRAHAHVHVGAFVAPFMDFNIVGFDLGMGGARAPEPAPPTYEAPPEAPEGFTRSPAERDVLMCPNCDIELCSGEDEIKSQVWIVKACGHVYCGECTANRSVKRSTKGKEKERPAGTAPFKTCVVEDCGKSVVHRKSMFQVFL
ncbi:hypothetical protein ACN47E_008377 [Coniothyrium glycines]